MRVKENRYLRWAPRLLSILYMAFLALFAFDVWGVAGDFVEKLAGFFIHLMPVYAVGMALLLAWRWRVLGGLLFLGLAAGFALVFDWDQLGTLLVMSGPLVVIGGLFLFDGYRSTLRWRPRLKS